MLGWRILLFGIFMVPFESVRPIRGVGMSVGDAALIVGGFLLMLDHAVRARKPNAEDGALVKLTWTIPGMMIITGIFLSTWVNSETTVVVEAFGVLLQIMFAFLYLPWLLQHLSPRQLESGMLAFVLGGATSIVIGLGLYLYANPFYDQLKLLGLVSEEADRPGLFTGVGSVARMAVLSLPLLWILYQRGRVRALPAAALTAISLIAVVSTRSGSGLLLLVLAIGGMAVAWLASRLSLAKPKGRSRSMAPVLLALVAVGVIGFQIVKAPDEGGETSLWSDFSARVLDPLSEGGVTNVGSAEYRLELNRIAFELIESSPLAGVGPGYMSTQIGGATPHMAPVTIWLDGGILAFTGYVMLWIGVFLMAVSAWRRDPKIGVGAMVVALVTVAAQFTMPYTYMRYILFPVLLVFFLVRSRPDPSGAADGSGESSDGKDVALPGPGPYQRNHAGVYRPRRHYQRH